MTLTIKDKCSQDLINGLLLLFKTYPEAKVRNGYGQDTIFTIPHQENKLNEDKVKLLGEWGWEYEDDTSNINSYWVKYVDE